MQRIRRSGCAAVREEDNKGGEVPVLTAQSIAQPGPETGPPRDLMTCLEKRNRWIVIDRFGVHGLEKTNLVSQVAEVGHQFTNPGSRLTMLGKRKDRGSDRERFLPRGHPGETLPLPNRIGQFLPTLTLQTRFVIEKIHLGWPAVHEQVDHPLRGGGDTRKLRRRFGRPEEINEGSGTESEIARKEPAA